MSRFLLACGGTGGHLAPGIALAQRLAEDGDECLLIVSRKAVDARMTAKYPALRFLPGSGRGFGPGLLGRLLFFPAFLGAVWASWRTLRSFGADAVVCFGGFMSLGPAVAAALAGVPVIVHEANRKPGKAVRLIARFARAVHLPPGVRVAGVAPERQSDSGYPVRKEIGPRPRAESRRALGLPEEGRMVLVLGGSQGAASLTRWAESALPELAARGTHLLCLTGPAGRDAVERHGGVTARFLPFCDRMAEAYAAADLAVSRAGAGTLAELAACRTPAVLVPLPTAADDHQSANAEHLAGTGAAVCVRESEIAGLSAEVCARLDDASGLARMRTALAAADAANRWDELRRHAVAFAKEGRAGR